MHRESGSRYIYWFSGPSLVESLLYRAVRGGRCFVAVQPGVISHFGPYRWCSPTNIILRLSDNSFVSSSRCFYISTSGRRYITTMGHKALFSAAMLFGRAAKAAYNEFTFTNEASKWTCPGMNFACSPPSICTFDTLLQKSVCCGSGGQDEVCWNESTQCGTNTVSCGDGDNSFCCLTDR